MNAILIKPIITEKSIRLAQNGWYTFQVVNEARKEQIASEVSKIYSVEIKSVRVIKVTGKTKRTGKKMIYKKRSDWKKALIWLKAGQTISAFQITNEETTKKK